MVASTIILLVVFLLVIISLIKGESKANEIAGIEKVESTPDMETIKHEHQVNSTQPHKQHFNDTLSNSTPSTNYNTCKTPQNNSEDFNAFPFFGNLNQRLDYLKKYGTSKHTDFILFSTFLSSLYANLLISESDIEESEKNIIMEKYEFFMYTFLFLWFRVKEPAKFIKNSEKIIENRMTAYTEIFYEHNKTDPEIAFEYVTDTLCWYLTYGWEHYPDGSLSTTPILNEDTSKILNLDPKIKTYYAPVISKLKEEIYNYIDSDLPLFMDFICSDVTGRGFGTFT